MARLDWHQVDAHPSASRERKLRDLRRSLEAREASRRISPADFRPARAGESAAVIAALLGLSWLAVAAVWKLATVLL